MVYRVLPNKAEQPPRGISRKEGNVEELIATVIGKGLAFTIMVGIGTGIVLLGIGFLAGFLPTYIRQRMYLRKL